MAQPESPHNVAAHADRGAQFLTFRLGAEEYAIDILGVQEIKGYTRVTPIPGSPPHVKGVMNLRGTVVPVLGLRERFGMPHVEYDKFTVVVIVTVGHRAVGIVVDAVTDVLTIADDQIEPPPELGSSVDASYITGMAKAADRLVIVLDLGSAVGGALGATPEPQRAA